MAILIIVGVVAVIVVFAVVSWQMEQKRRQELAATAARLGLTYSTNDLFGLPSRYGHIGTFNQGHSRKAYNLLYGDYRGRNVVAFDYLYKTTSHDSKGRRHETTHHLSAVVTELPAACPGLVIRPEGLLDKVAAAVGFDDIDFESAEFSSKFYVKSADRKFAYDVCDARMMEWLLARRGWRLEVCGNLLVLTASGRFRTEQFPQGIETSVDFFERWPDHLVKQLTGK